MSWQGNVVDESNHPRSVRSRWSIVAMSCVSSTAPSSVERRRVVSDELRAGKDNMIPRRPETERCSWTVLDRRTLRVLVYIFVRYWESWMYVGRLLRMVFEQPRQSGLYTRQTPKEPVVSGVYCTWFCIYRSSTLLDLPKLVQLV